MERVLLIALGGAVGSVLRYLVSGAAQELSRSATFPFGTVAVNLIGCFVIGVLWQLADSRGAFAPETRALVFVGVLGGFTTFSTFANESVNLLRDGEWAYALLNVAVQVVGGLLAVLLGRAVAFAMWR